MGREGLLKNEIYGSWLVKSEADQSKLVNYTDSSSEEEDPHVDINFDEPNDLNIN